MANHWDTLLGRFVEREVVVLLNTTTCPLMCAMTGTLLATDIASVWSLKCRASQGPDKQMTPSGILYFTTSDVVRVFDQNASPLTVQ